MKHLAPLVLGVLATLLAAGSSRADNEFEPLETELVDRAVVMKLPDGVRRVRLRVKQDDGTWKTCTIAHLEGSEGYLKLRLPDGVAEKDLEVTASWTDPFPYSFYQGRTEHSGTEATDTFAATPGFGPQVREDAADNPEQEAAVEESDIWKWRGSTLYFFNQFRGLQVIDVSDPAAPDRLATMRIDSYGEQMYLHPEDDSVILLTHDQSSGNGEVLLVAHESTHALQQRASFPVPGYILESRLVGNILYVVSRNSWQDTTTDDGGTVHVSWRTGLSVTKIDLSDPANPVAAPPLHLANGQYYYWGAQVQATAKALLVATNTYDSALRQSLSTVHVIDISDPGEPPAVTHHLSIAGQVLNKFNMHLDGDILTVVSQVWRGSVNRQRHASVETFDLSRSSPRLAGLEFANNESITATRFVGDRLYVVTFLLIDPLFVVDLSDPARPKLLSELEIPGFSTYLQPHGEDALLSIGVEDSRIAVSWFDVSDPTDTSLASRVYIGAEDGWSWTEANWDEKALGYFPDDNLMLVPYQGSVPNLGWTSGVQLVEIGDRELIKRGSFTHEFQARRARVLGETVVSISGRSLKSLDVSDRDNPQLLAELVLAWPADVVHRVADVLVQLERGPGYYYWSGSSATPPRLHVSPVGDPDELLASLDLPGGRIAGSFLHGDCLFVAQTTLVSHQVEDHTVTSETFTTTVIDLGDPDRPIIIGRASTDASSSTSYYGFSSDLVGALLPDGALVWYPAEQTHYYFWDIMPLAGAAPLGGDLIYPWFPASGRVFTVDISDKAQPEILAAVDLAGGDGAWPEGNVRLLGSTIYHGLQKTESVLRADDTTRWISRHWLGQLDLSDPGNPVHGDLVELPGSFEHAYASGTGGTTLFTSHSGYLQKPDGSYRSELRVQALAFDGLMAFLLDELVVPDWNYGPRVFDGRFLVLGNNLYANNSSTSTLAVHEWLASGSFQEGPTLQRPDYVHRLGVSDHLLVAQGTGLAFIDFADPADPEPAVADFPKLGFWQRADLIDIHERKSAYLPQGLQGVRTLDFEGVFDDSAPTPSPARGQDSDSEWQVVPLGSLVVTASTDVLLLGELPSGEDWMFADQITQYDYATWMRMAFRLGINDLVPDPHADSDFDGQTNLWEFYTGTNPNDPRDFTNLEVTGVTDPDGERYLHGFLSLNPHAAAITRVRPLASSDLAAWTDPAAWTDSSDPFRSGFGFRLDTPIGTEPAVFVRVELSPDP